MSRPYLFSMTLTKRERLKALQWLQKELEDYADPKWEEALAARPGHDIHMAEEGVERGLFWEAQVTQYIQRAATLGLDNPLGRQALCKGWAAYLGMLESMVRVYGPPPAGGFPSGQLPPVAEVPA